MKKTRFLTVISALVLLTGCGGGSGEHVHTFSEEWSFDENKHWHQATCHPEDEEAREKVGAHAFGEAYIKDNKEMKKCSKCGYEAEVDHSKEFDVVELGEEISIHTSAQKAYLAYSGDYSAIPSSVFKDGNKSGGVNSISDPLKQTISWEYDNHTDTTQYSVSISQDKNFTNAFEIKGNNEQQMEIYNFFLGKNYYKVNAYNDEGVRVSSGTFEVDVDAAAPRNIYAGPTATNMRDLGGREAENGAKVKQGLIYRTCGNGYSTTNRVMFDDEVKKVLVNELGVKTEINVGDNTTYNFNWNNVKCYDTLCDYANDANPSKHHFSRNTESIKNVFEVLGNRDSYPLVFHCRIGTDRTGLVAILVYGVLGVELNSIYQDYLFSNFGAIGNLRSVGAAAGDDNIEEYIKEIQAMPGDTFQEKVYNTLLTIGVPATTIENVMNILLDGEKPDNDFDQVVVTADQMKFASTTLKTDEKTNGIERDNPVYYAQLTSGATATVDFEITSAGKRAIYAYIAYADSTSAAQRVYNSGKVANNNLKINGSIQAQVDGNAITLPDMTFAAAGMGSCAGRKNYYFVKLGEVDGMNAGAHKIVIQGIANNLYLGNVAILAA